MTEPRIVSPKEAQRVEKALLTSPYSRFGIDAALLHTVATEPDRIRAAVQEARRCGVEAGRQAAERALAAAFDPDSPMLKRLLDAIENGADY